MICFYVAVPQAGFVAQRALPPACSSDKATNFSFRLLDILAARKDPYGLSGDILINGAPQPANFKCTSGYVVQVSHFYHCGFYCKKLLLCCKYLALSQESWETPENYSQHVTKKGGLSNHI